MESWLEFLQAIKDGCKFILKNKSYTLKDFQEKWTDNDEGDAIDVLRVFHKKGQLDLAINKTDEQIAFEQAGKEEAIREKTEMIQVQEDQERDYQALKKREGKLLYKGIALDFSSYEHAIEAMEYFSKNLRLKEMEISDRDDKGIFKLQIYHITEGELKAINFFYKSTRLMKKFGRYYVDSTDKTYAAVDYAAKNILSPIVKAEVSSTVALLRTGAAVAAKSGAILVTETAKGIRNLKHDLTHDPELTKAANDLINAKDFLRRQFKSKRSVATGVSMIE